jgi:DNA-binding beta-propeller fold protein YncE
MKNTLLATVFLVLVRPLMAQIPGDIDDRVLLPNGWWLSPVGEQIRLGDFPMNAALTDDEAYLAILHAGASKAQVMLFDVKGKKVTQAIQLNDAWQGIAFQGADLYVSGGYQNCVYRFRLDHGTLVAADTIRLVEGKPKYDGAAAGLDIKQNTLAVVFRRDSTLRYYDVQTKKQSIVKLTGMPYSCKFDAKGILIVSIWGSKKIQVFEKEKLLYECPTGDHPNEIIISDDNRFAYISCANDNTVSVIDLQKKKAVASVSTAIHPDAPEGSTTNSVCLTPDQKTVLAANADNNSLTIVDVRDPVHPRPAGFVPVGWYPTKVMILRDKTVLVVNGKGGRSLANPLKQYIASLFDGTLSIFKLPGEKELLDYSRQVFKNTPYKQASLLKADYAGASAVPKKVGDSSPIKHVLYVIKENRTYDQVFGDMPEGNGDTSLCLFGETVSPNHHKLAREFTLFDNFYVNSEVSADGHNWSMAAYATDYVEKTWPSSSSYSKRNGPYDFEGGEPTATPKAGYLWTTCVKKGVSFRVYGEFIDPPTPDGKPAKPRDPGIGKNFSPTYLGWDLDYSDVDRYKAWEKEFSEFEKNGKLPSLCIMHLPNDHTAGTKKGALTPKAYVAQNDYALGLIVERFSKSRYWKESAIFVVEDDAQNGPDHIDAHRSVGMVFSPYIKKHTVNHTLYTTTSMLRTIELILGLPPMSQYDAGATPMFDAFAPKPDLAPYVAERPRIDLNQKNKPGSPGQSMMEKFNLKREDAIPDRAFNEIIWRAVKGTPMPAPRYSIFSRAQGAEEED